jgi:hypothetical protein
MKLSGLLAPLLLSFFAGYIFPLSLGSLDSVVRSRTISCGRPWFAAFRATEVSDFLARPAVAEVFEDPSAIPEHRIVKTPDDGGIKLDFPDKYKERFEKWKAELLSTDFGRQQWDNYADNKQFILTITISEDVGKGAGTGKYLWDDGGRFVGATITLGDDLDKGYPSPVYYPVMNSLSLDETSYAVNPRILAATKLSHEIGHVDQTARANGSFLRLQDKLMPVYNSIFLKNGLKTSDKKLVELADQMGGTPIEIWESREYWSEVEAMAYLKERISKENFYCRVFSKIRQNVEEYARDYKDRFEKSPGFTTSPCWN